MISSLFDRVSVVTTAHGGGYAFLEMFSNIPSPSIKTLYCSNSGMAVSSVKILKKASFSSLKVAQTTESTSLGLCMMLEQWGLLILTVFPTVVAKCDRPSFVFCILIVLSRNQLV